jgi:N-glycosidase YbiA
MWGLCEVWNDVSAYYRIYLRCGVYQAQKFAGTPHEEEIRQANSPMIAARLGRSRKRPLRRDWESVKDTVMREAVLAKFTQHADVRAILLGTGDAEIVEHTTNDSYWGDGGDGTGKNKLGQILMSVREELRTQEQQQQQ